MFTYAQPSSHKLKEMGKILQQSRHSRHIQMLRAEGWP
jgi:hypothetical protein